VEVFINDRCEGNNYNARNAPQAGQDFACEIMKRLIIAWDPDFTKLTPNEAADLKIAHTQIANGETFAHEDIDWDNLDEMDLD